MVIVGDYDLLREHVGLVERRDRCALRLRGRDAAEFLQGQVTNDIAGLVPGSGCYAALLDHKGKLRADMRILRGGDWIWIDCDRESLPTIERTARVYGIGRDIGLEGADAAILSLLGPAADAVVEPAPPQAEHSFVEGPLGMHVRTDLGVDVVCDAAAADGVRASLGVPPVAEAAAECLRIESGRPRLGIDMTHETIPEEAGLNERAVSFTKGCYVGQETVARLHYKGKPNRHLRGLRLSEPAPSGAELRSGDRVVGAVGSSAVSPVHGPIALAIVRREVGPGDTLSVGDGSISADVVALPFDPV